MAVYFIREKQPDDLIKIGVSIAPPKRTKHLQTGNPRPLELLGWIFTDDRNDFALERELHAKYASNLINGEWFSISTGLVLDELKRAGARGFVATNDNAFAILDWDQDGIPEYVGVCKWVDLEFCECCPYCGCMCGMHEVSDTNAFHCLHCDTLTDFDDLPG
ncbi:hypothetical protein RSP795_22300 [Ralstonia solanacearum]|uniref:GIY-YIG nuclease family protein n=1 Tax=Ralstonia solanacearum TaxID=305 RepID=UPI0007D87BB1|nr:GIY-YIG nuclease family protein [Ralstonia solanacearum]OAI58930.1 hypothetical protein RSP795_22300 [Ralstonia solanacearum]